MTYQQIYQAVENTRFDSSLRDIPGGIKDWIRTREEEVWDYAPWPIKQLDGVSVSVNFSAPNKIPLYNAQVGGVVESLQLYDQYGTKMEYLSPEEFTELVQSYSSG